LGRYPRTPQELRFRNRLLWYCFFVVSLLFCFFYWSIEIEYDFWGAIAQARVVGFQDVFNSNGVRLQVVRVNFEYFDKESESVCLGSYYLDWNAPMPMVGEKFGVRYISREAGSAERPDDSLSSPLWATMPVVFLWGLRALSVWRGEWKPIDQLYSEMHPSTWAYKSLTNR